MNISIWTFAGLRRSGRREKRPTKVKNHQHDHQKLTQIWLFDDRAMLQGRKEEKEERRATSFEPPRRGEGGVSPRRRNWWGFNHQHHRLHLPPPHQHHHLIFIIRIMFRGEWESWWGRSSLRWEWRQMLSFDNERSKIEDHLSNDNDGDDRILVPGECAGWGKQMEGCGCGQCQGNQICFCCFSLFLKPFRLTGVESNGATLPCWSTEPRQCNPVKN